MIVLIMIVTYMTVWIIQLANGTKGRYSTTQNDSYLPASSFLPMTSSAPGSGGAGVLLAALVVALAPGAPPPDA
jgi:hypothetical protein